MHGDLLHTALIEDLNRLACAADQERLGGDVSRAREALDGLRWIDTTELPRWRRQGWLDRRESDLIEQFFRFASGRLGQIPSDQDPLAFARADPGWQAVRERAVELIAALDAFVDIGVPGWGHQYKARARVRARHAT